MIKYYGFMKNSLNLAIPCKQMEGQSSAGTPMVGSIFCKSCEYFVSRNTEMQTVECSHEKNQLPLAQREILKALGDKP